MQTTLYILFLYYNNLDKFNVMRKYNKRVKSTNMDFTLLDILIFTYFSSRGIWLLNDSYNFVICFKMQMCVFVVLNRQFK